MVNNMKNFCCKSADVTKKVFVRTADFTRTMGNKIIDHVTPKRDYSNLPEKDAECARQFDRALAKETVIDCCWWAFYVIFYMAMITIAIKQQAESKNLFIEKEE